MKKNFKKGFYGKNNAKDKEISINFFLIDSFRVGIQIPYGYCVQQLKKYIQQAGNGNWNFEDKCWIIDRQSYSKIVQKFQDYYFKTNSQQKNTQKLVKVNTIQDFVFKVQKTLQQEVQEISCLNLKPYQTVRLKYNSIQTEIEPESLPFYKKLFDFQKQSLKFGIKKHGRMLLADEMGVGKTIQSLAIAYIYKHQWPLLIICPTTLKLNWQNQIKRWYPDIQPHNIQLINHAKTAFRMNVSIMIISYDLAWRMKQMFEHVKVVIVDQAHYLKSCDSKRSQILVPFLSSRKRIILLTGTPAFARPKQIYNLISIVRPGLFKNFKLFGNRYCDPKWNHWSHGYQYNGCKNVKQLYYFLKGNIMMRRLKSEVLTELPDKNRQKIILETDPAIVKNIKEVLQKNNIQKMETFFSEYINSINSVQQESLDKREEIMQAYRLSGMAKIKAVRQYLDEILQNQIKILVFAHHQKVLDEIETELKNKKRKFIRIDGKVNIAQRQSNVQKFQNDPQILVALLSITAAGIGITLTAASTVIFAELHWTPALMIQAQDRAHRVGQKDSVNCHYLIGENTLDEMLYKFLQRKVLNVSSFIDGQSKDLQFQELRKGQKGKFSKKDEENSSSQAFFKKVTGSANLLPLLNFKKTPTSSDINLSPSQQSSATQISQSSFGQKQIGSRKRSPMSATLDNFLFKKKSPSSKQIVKKLQSNQFKTINQNGFQCFQSIQQYQQKNVNNQYNITSNRKKIFEQEWQQEEVQQKFEKRSSILLSDVWQQEDQKKHERYTISKRSQGFNSSKLLERPLQQSDKKREKYDVICKRNNPDSKARDQSQSSIDSDQQFQKALQIYAKSKANSVNSTITILNKNQVKGAQEEETQQNGEKQEETASLSQTQSINGEKNKNVQQQEYEI